MSSIPFRVAIPNSEMKPMNGGDTHFSRCDEQGEYTAYQCQRQIDKDDGALLHTAEFMVEEQEYHH